MEKLTRKVVQGRNGKLELESATSVDDIYVQGIAIPVKELLEAIEQVRRTPHGG